MAFLAKWVGVALSILLSLLLLASFYRIGLAFWWYSDIADWSITTLGWDEPAAVLFASLGAVAAVLIAPYVTAFITFGRYRLLVSSISALAAVGVYLLITFAGKDVFVDQRTGKPLRWYVETPDGIVFSRVGGYDPKYGLKKNPVTSAVMVALGNEKAGMRPKLVSIDSLKQTEPFDSTTGKPKLWVWSSPTGAFELYDAPGFHPRTREVLLPITPVLAGRIERYLDIARQRRELDAESAKQIADSRQRAAEFARYVRPAHHGQQDAAVICTTDGRWDQRLSSHVAQVVLRQPRASSPPFFSDEFFADGLFDRGMAGDLAVAGPQLASQLRRVFLCRGVVTIADSGEQGLLKATAKLEIRQLEAKDSRTLDYDSVTAIAAGFSREIASARALDAAAVRLSPR